MDIKTFLQINCLGENNKDSWEKPLSTLKITVGKLWGKNKGMK